MWARWRVSKFSFKFCLLILLPFWLLLDSYIINLFSLCPIRTPNIFHRWERNERRPWKSLLQTFPYEKLSTSLHSKSHCTARFLIDFSFLNCLIFLQRFLWVKINQSLMKFLKLNHWNYRLKSEKTVKSNNLWSSKKRYLDIFNLNYLKVY